MKKIVLFITVLFFSSLIIVNAEEEINDIQIENELLIEKQEIEEVNNKFDYNIQDDFTIEKEVNGSGIYIGQDITLNKNINGIGFFLTKGIDINADLDYGIILSQKLEIDNVVKRDLFSASTIFKLNEEGKINRDLFVFSNEVSIEGEIYRDAFIGATSVIIKNGAKISGDVKIGANRIVIEEGAVINGLLKYNDSAQTEIANKEQFNIETYKGDFIGNENEKTHDIYLFIYKTVGIMLMFLLINWLFPKIFVNLKSLYEKPINYLKNISIGLGIFIVLPILSLFLMIPNFTFYIGLFCLLIYFCIMYISFVFSGYLLGNFINELVFPEKSRIIIFSLIGILVLNVLSLLPFVNILVILLGFGSTFWLIVNSKNQSN